MDNFVIFHFQIIYLLNITQNTFYGLSNNEILITPTKNINVMGRLTILENTKFNPLCRHIILDPSLKALTVLCMDVPLRIHQNKSETKTEEKNRKRTLFP